jgi:membrane-associated phospholipid phosphatase
MSCRHRTLTMTLSSPGGRTIRSRSRLRIAGFSLLALSLLASTVPARADTPDERRVRWRDEWPRFRAWEYVATATALGTGFYLRFGVEQGSANWRSGIAFDDALLDRIGLETIDARQRAKTITDALFFGSMGYRLVDSAVVPLVAYGDGDLALQMSMIDLEAFGGVAIVLWGSQQFVRRERPKVARHCDDPQLSPTIDECALSSAERNRSFIAGHPAVGMAAAGLTCTHHAHIPLYGGGAADTLACGLMIGAAGMNGIGRLWIESHYPSDLLLGWGLGALAGFGLPALLHYSPRRQVVARAHDPISVRGMVVPLLAEDEIGLGLTGVF